MGIRKWDIPGRCRCWAKIPANKSACDTCTAIRLGVRPPYSAVRTAIRKGLLPTPLSKLCVDCGTPATEYDHRDDRFPLNVEPVCHSCNIRRWHAFPHTPSLFRIAQNALSE